MVSTSTKSKVLYSLLINKIQNFATTTVLNRVFVLSSSLQPVYICETDTLEHKK